MELKLLSKKKINGWGIGEKSDRLFFAEVGIFNIFVFLCIKRHIRSSFLLCQIMSYNVLSLSRLLTEEEKELGPL